MDGINPPTRLRNACDECHKLKRRCTGTMPCEKCTSLGSLCFYSVVSRLGRPPGSRSQRRAQAKSPPVQKRGPSPDQNHEATSASFDTDSMMDFNVDNFDTTSLYELFINSTQSPGAAPNPFSAAGSEADVLQDIDRLPALDTSYLKQPNTGTITPVSLSPEQGRQQQQQQQQQQQLRLVKQLPDPRSWALFLQQQQQQQQQQQAQRQTQQSPRHIRSTPSSSCQCIPNLSSLLHDLKRTEDDKMPQVSLDTVLARTSDAIAQWSAFASCPRCQNNDGEDDDGETLLLAALTMRRVVALLKASDLQPGVSKENDEVEGKDVGPQLQFGTFRIAGSDRTMLLRVLRTITFRKLDTFVTSMQSMLRSKQTQHSGADDAILNHIKAILVELAKMVKVQ